MTLEGASFLDRSLQSSGKVNMVVVTKSLTNYVEGYQSVTV